MSTSQTKVILWGFPKQPDLASPSGFCQKLETFLKFTSTPYEVRESSTSKAPKRKLPYADIHHDGKTVTMADSHFIIRYLIENGISTDPDDGLTSAQKAESRAFQALMEDVLYTAIVCERWYVDENYATLVTEMFSSIPWPIRSVVTWMIRRNIKTALWRAGVGRHSLEEIYRLEKEGFEALDARLSLHPYFHGDKPSLIDITIGGFLANCLDTKADPYFSDKVMASPVLRSFCHRINAPLFPEYKHLLGELTAGDKLSEEGTAETS